MGRVFSAFAKFFSLLWSEASSLTLCKHGFVWLKMYFKNVTNYPMACNHFFRAVIGLSCKYLIRGLGKWGGWEDAVSRDLLATSPSPGPGETLGSPASVAGGGGTFSGCTRGCGAVAPWTGLGPARIRTQGILKLPSLMGTNCPNPSSTLHAQRMCLFQLK